MTFYETPRFPDYLAFGLQVSFAFATDLIEVNSGQVSTNARWSQPLRLFDGRTTHRTSTQRNEIEAFFAAIARGRANAFRIKDVTDYDADSRGVLTAISSSPSGTYQLGKTYTSGVTVFTREITKPNDPIVVAGGGTYNVDYTTGIVTHTAGPAPTGWTGTFDVPVQFLHDDLVWEVAAKKVSGGGEYLYIATQMQLREVRV